MKQEICVKNGCPGPKTREMLIEMEEFESRGDLCFANYGMPPVIEEADGAYVQDIDGNTYLDLTSGFAALNLGHCPKEVIDAAVSQMKKVHHTAQLPTCVRVELAKKLVEIAPGELRNNSKVQYDTGGTNAVEVGMKLAKSYTKRPYIFCYSGAYHGRSHGTLSVSCFPFLKRDFFPIMPGAQRIPYPYCYRCPYGKVYGSCGMQCLKSLEDMFEDPAWGFVDRKKDTNLVAGILMEPCQGAGGYIIPPLEYWQGVRKICDKYQVMLIDDEVQMGWGRSGSIFAIEEYNTYPDIMAVGKAFTAGIIPNAAIIARSDIMDVFQPIHQSVTFSGNPVGSAAALAMLRVLEEQNILNNVKIMGAYFYDKLKELEEKHPIIGIVQGMGLILSVEFVKNRETKEPASEETKELIQEMLKNGLITTISGHYGNRINLVAPLIIKKSDIDAAVKIMDSAITKIEGVIK